MSAFSKQQGYLTVSPTLIAICCSTFAAANPTLPPGAWVNISPPISGVWCNDVQYAPSNHNVLFACMTYNGPSKSTDGGATWTSIHGNSTIKSPQRVRVDPDNIDHLYAICGVGGNRGFYVTTDGGANWTEPEGFLKAIQTAGGGFTGDMYYISVDPTDFNHFLLSFHYPWASGTSGVLESKDGGITFTIHYPDGWSGSGHNVFFLYDPGKKIGNNQTWLLGVQDGGGYWRTTNAGKSWAKVYDGGMTHGGMSIYYAKSGLLYATAGTSLIRSPDNGATWQAIPKAPFNWYYAMEGDGDRLYTCPNTGPMIVSPQDDGLNWTQLNAQTFTGNSTMMTFDPDNRIMYSAQRENGVWAMKVPPKTTSAQVRHANFDTMPVKATLGFSKQGIVVRSATGKVCGVNGRRLTFSNLTPTGMDDWKAFPSRRHEP